MKTKTPPPLDLFLEKCRNSGKEAYDQFKGLLLLLEDPTTQKTALQFFQDLYLKWPSLENCLKNYHFTFSSLTLDPEDSLYGTLILLQLPSTFTPEEWSFTFFEGLARYPIGEFQGKTVCELGCGNGWISLAVAGKFWPSKIYGLDINPRAITSSKLNIFLNGFHPDGTEKKDAEGKTLRERVEFHESDLLQFLREEKVGLDRIIGCIPQVLGPDPQLALNMISENASDEFLYSLSNYCGKQGLIEDQFGLGLVARALEEGVELLRPSGKIILNLGGRPGSAILERLFLRRGFFIRKVWHKKVEQAGDTDIASLVQIEKGTTHRFEFYMGPSSRESIGAQTAQFFQQAGGRIYHSLTVYDAYLGHPNPIQRIMRRLNDPAYQESRSAMDLSFTDSQIGDEKIHFLANLADKLGHLPSFPYGPQEGDKKLRHSLTLFFKFYFHWDIHESSVLIGPSRTHLIKNILFLLRPKLSLVNKEIFKSVENWEGEHSSSLVLETPLNSHQVCDLARALRPQLVVAALTPQEGLDSDSFLRLVEMGNDIGAYVVVDISLFFELSSNPQASASGVFDYLTRHPLPPHVFLLCGLIRNQVYSDLEISFLLSENADFLEQGKKLADLTFCRPPLLAQLYYQTLLQELLKFQIPQIRPSTSHERKSTHPTEDFYAAFGHLCPKVKMSLDHPALAAESRTFTPQTIRLDYGENELPTPTLLKSCLFEGFLRQNMGAAEMDPRPELLGLLKNRFGLESHPQEIFLYGHGVTPLFSALMQVLASKKASLLVPQGTYGYFTAMAEFFGVELQNVTTLKENQFKMTSQDLQKLLPAFRQKYPERELWVFVNFPVVNPTGAIYAPSEIWEILHVCNLYQVRVVFDTIFSGLEFPSPTSGRDAYALEQNLLNLPAKDGGFGGLTYLLMGGLSKELSAGGLRFGFAYTRSLRLAHALKEALGPSPHSTLLYAVKKIYSQLQQHQPDLMGHLLEQKRMLKKGALSLQEALTECGWDVLPPQGGLFLVAAPTAYLGRKTAEGVVLSAQNIPDILYHKTHLLINGPFWTNLPGLCRFVISMEEETLRKGISALRAFHQEILGDKVRSP